MGEGANRLRYKYIAFKYTRKVNPADALHSAWNSFGSWSQQPGMVWRPPTDVYETPDELVVLVELAGVAEDDMAVTLFSDLLVVEGVRTQASCTSMNACHQLGIKYGEFRTEVHIPFPVDNEKVNAEYKNGLLRVTFKKID
jgi:HSP20 family protein